MATVALVLIVATLAARSCLILLNPISFDATPFSSVFFFFFNEIVTRESLMTCFSFFDRMQSKRLTSN